MRKTAAREPERPTVAVVECLGVYRRGLVEILTEQGYATTGMGHGTELVSGCKQGKVPHLAVVQLQLPEMDGFVLLGWLREHRPHVRTLAMAYRPEDALVRRAMRMGASGVFCHTASEADVLRAVHDVLTTGTHYNDLLHRQVVQPAEHMLAQPDEATDELSKQERRFVQVLCTLEEPTLERVAKRMQVSLNTVKTYKRRVFAKLGLRSLPALVRWGFLNGKDKS